MSFILILTTIAKNIIIDKQRDDAIKIKLNFRPKIRPMAPSIWRNEISLLYSLNPHLLNSLTILFDVKELNPYTRNEMPVKAIIAFANSI